MSITMATGSMTLEQKLRAILDQGDSGEGPIGQAGQHPERGSLTEFEADLRDWGVIYGMAFGIARGEEPFETLESVAERALKAAWPVFLHHGHGFAERDRDDSVRLVVQQYDAARDGGPPTMTDELALAIERLARAVGQ